MTNAGDKETLEKSEKWMDGMGPPLAVKELSALGNFQ